MTFQAGAVMAGDLSPQKAQLLLMPVLQQCGVACGG